MQRDPQELIDAMEHVSFEMNRYLYTAQLKGPYPQIVAESCFLHSRIVGEFFYGDKRMKDDIGIEHYYDLLTSKDELEVVINSYKSKWIETKGYRERLNKKLCHLTFDRVGDQPMNTQEKDEFGFENLIRLFEKKLPEEFKQQWERGKAIALR